MLKVGLVGEDPNDTLSLKLLLLKSYNKKVKFYQLAKGIRGYQLDNPKTKRVVIVEKENHKCNFIIYIRDLDSFYSEKNKVKTKKDWFDDLNKTTGNDNILLLNIWELEALILADIETFNRIYHVECPFKGNPELVKEPKEMLFQLTRREKKKYKESHCPEIFAKLDISKIKTNCSSFKSFILEFEKRIDSNK